MARRDRASVALTSRRWSAETADAPGEHDWRAIPGACSRQLARHIAHTAGVHWFLARLAEQARAEGGWRVVQLDPPHRAARYSRYGGGAALGAPRRVRSAAARERGAAVLPRVERRALHPSTMAARLAPYLRYYATDRPRTDHDSMPTVLVVFDDTVAPTHLLRVARTEMERSDVDVPLWAASRECLQAAGPRGDS